MDCPGTGENLTQVESTGSRQGMGNGLMPLALRKTWAESLQVDTGKLEWGMRMPFRAKGGLGRFWAEEQRRDQKVQEHWAVGKRVSSGVSGVGVPLPASSWVPSRAGSLCRSCGTWGVSPGSGSRTETAVGSRAGSPGHSSGVPGQQEGRDSQWGGHLQGPWGTALPAFPCPTQLCPVYISSQ